MSGSLCLPTYYWLPLHELAVTAEARGTVIIVGCWNTVTFSPSPHRLAAVPPKQIGDSDHQVRLVDRCRAHRA